MYKINIAWMDGRTTIIECTDWDMSDPSFLALKDVQESGEWSETEAMVVPMGNVRWVAFDRVES